MSESEKRVARGVYQTFNAKGQITGWRVYARVKTATHPKGRLFPKRLPASMTEGQVKKWRAAWQTDLRRASERGLPVDPAAMSTAPNDIPKPIAEWIERHGAPVPDGFADDAINKYLPAVRAMPTYKERVRHIMLWVERFGNRKREAIKAFEIRTIRDEWHLRGPKLVQQRPRDKDGQLLRDAHTGKPLKAVWVAVPKPLSASQCNNRLRALENLWSVLDGPHATNPARDVPELDEGDHRPKSLTLEVIDQILDQMPDQGRPEQGTRDDVSKTKLRLRIMQWSGLAPAQIGRVAPEDFDRQTGALFLRRRRKGRYQPNAKGRTIILLPQALEAFIALEHAGGLGPFSTSAMWKTFQRAAARAGFQGLSPYQLRHTFATITVLASNDLDLARELLGQSSIETTRRYAQAAIHPRLQAGVEDLKARLFGKPRRGQKVTGRGNLKLVNTKKAAR